MTPIWCCADGDLIISVGSSVHSKIIEHHVLPFCDASTRLKVSVALCEHDRNDLVDVDFKVDRLVPAPLFAITECTDHVALARWMKWAGLDASQHLWNTEHLHILVCRLTLYSFVWVTKNDYYTSLLIEENLYEPCEDPEEGKDICVLSEVPNLLSLLPAIEPQRPGESKSDFHERARNDEFFEKRLELWKLYVRRHNIDEVNVPMCPELFRPE